MKAVLAPMLIAAVGIILSIIGIFAVKTKENATMKNLLNSLAAGTNLSSVLIVAATFGILYMLDFGVAAGIVGDRSVGVGGQSDAESGEHTHGGDAYAVETPRDVGEVKA